jgi:hypothetical protein
MTFHPASRSGGNLLLALSGGQEGRAWPALGTEPIVCSRSVAKVAGPGVESPPDGFLPGCAGRPRTQLSSPSQQAHPADGRERWARKKAYRPPVMRNALGRRWGRPRTSTRVIHGVRVR